MNRLVKYFEPEIIQLKYGTCKGRDLQLTKQEEKLIKRGLAVVVAILVFAYAAAI